MAGAKRADRRSLLPATSGRRAVAVRVLEKAPEATDKAADADAEFARLSKTDAFEELKNMNKQSVNRPQKVCARQGPRRTQGSGAGETFWRGTAVCVSTATTDDLRCWPLCASLSASPAPFNAPWMS